MAAAFLLSSTLQAQSLHAPTAAHTLPVLVGQYNCQRFQGMVKYWSGDRGHGIIEIDAGREVFVHYTAIVDGRQSLGVGSRVEFCVAEGNTATHVVRL